MTFIDARALDEPETRAALKRRMRTPVVLLGLASALFAAALALTLVDVAREGAIERRSRQASATVLGHSDSSNRLDLRIDAILGAGRYRSIQVGPVYDDFDPGDQVELFVDRTDPDLIHLRGNERAIIGAVAQVLLPWIWAAGGALLLIALCAWRSWYRLRGLLDQHGWQVLTLRRGSEKDLYVADEMAAAFTSWTVLPRYFQAEVAGPLGHVGAGKPHCVIRVRGSDELVFVTGPVSVPEDSEADTPGRRDLVPPDPDAVRRFLAWAPVRDGEPTTMPAEVAIVHHTPSDGWRCGLWSTEGSLLGVIDHAEKRLLDTDERTVIEWEDRAGTTAFIVEDVDVAVHSGRGLALSAPAGSFGTRRRRGEYTVCDGARVVAHGLLHTGRAEMRGQWRCGVIHLDDELEGWERAVVLLDVVLGLAVVPSPPASD